MSDIAIKFENISKQYRLGLVSTQTLSHDLNRWWQINVLKKEDPYLKIGETNDRSTKGISDYVWALRNIDFEVKQGDVLGIIGKNGAGKSTLLKILSKVTAPTTGTIKAKGRIASLLEVGTGFHPELTGRENIYMNGAILGMTKAEIDRKLDEIVDFSGVERYLETPVKRYSSGMTVRLGFAIAAHLDPEILVVDEVLAVGDAEFQKKAIGKMQDVSRGGGRTVLFVSHNMGAVKSLCNTGIILENGSTSFISDDINVTVAKYLHEEKEQLRVPLAKRKDRQGNGNIHIVDVLFCGKNNYVNISNDEKLNFDIVFENRKKINNPKILISINTYDDQCILFLDSTTIHDSPKILNVKSKLHIRLSDEFSLIPNSYYVNIACYEDEVLSDYIQKAFTFDIIQGAFYSGGRMPVGNGLCMVKQEWFFQ